MFSICADLFFVTERRICHQRAASQPPTLPSLTSLRENLKTLVVLPLLTRGVPYQPFRISASGTLGARVCVKMSDRLPDGGGSERNSSRNQPFAEPRASASEFSRRVVRDGSGVAIGRVRASRIVRLARMVEYKAKWRSQ